MASWVPPSHNEDILGWVRFIGRAGGGRIPVREYKES